jgi:hypothetical protein
MAFTIDMAWTIVMSSGRTRSAGAVVETQRVVIIEIFCDPQSERVGQ